MTEFSEALIQKTIKVFKEENGVELTREEVIIALINLSGLFIAFVNKKRTS